ncbi:bifunctional riboflavin kinase/FAD synthetase [Kribbella sandramycini]|uniref:Riboflavin biosynthesis protein n=1 Tax=Kribbella sandramycini TaxID=60450 RepID=A0A7Y4KU72_9ACTN|nr:bifunctional riboflavin kinase/FAD synthetase [Kribbella sandramycini]MBB6568640.1 riboflavin kinase/FMN adenylyltransferase [Kribbella sandramycini]NOL38774.1 bifunctional riboflavin kinase/FAD synthetase [Kribbella sandramycini]
MRVWHGLDEVGAEFGPSVVTIGNFDGVHRGHQEVLAHAKARAAELGGLPVVALTFDPHPMRVLRPDHAPLMLSEPGRRAELLGRHGADAVLILPFDKDVAAWSPEEFIERVLVGTLHAKAIVVGENFRFGHRAAGHVDTLVAAGATHGFQVEGLSLAGDAQPWSSTYVRRQLAEGNVEAAAGALGRPLRVTGVVVEGDKRGRELGYPTANIPADPAAAVPQDGVYAGWLTVLTPAAGGPAYGESMPAAISVGSNPTFDGVDRRVESYVLDRDDLELYGARIAIDFVARLRGTQIRFETIDDLLVQMKADVDQARRTLTEN